MRILTNEVLKRSDFEWAAILFFAALLAVGLSTYRDYGAHWDEMTNQDFGRYWGLQVEKRFGAAIDPSDAEFLNNYRVSEHDLTHGTFFEVLLHFTEKAFLPKHPDSREVILHRHRMVFFMWYLAAIGMYFLSRGIFNGSPVWGLAGASVFVLNPSIYSHGFYNSVDIPMMTFYLLSTGTLLNLLKRPGFRAAAVHGVLLGLLCDVRLAGLLMVAITYAALGWEILKNSRKPGPPKPPAFSLRNLITLSVAFSVTLFAFWPLLWNHLGSTFVEALKLSQNVKSIHTPWWYNPFWIAVTSPITEIVYILTGLAAIALLAVRRRTKDQPQVILVAITVLFPLLVTVLAQTSLFDAWRHHYFIWPGLVILCLFGLKASLQATGFISKPALRRALYGSMIGLFVADLALVAKFMVFMHPYEQVYAGPLAGENGQRARFDGSIDWWGLSVADGLRYIAKTDQSRDIRVFIPEIPNFVHPGYFILPPKERERIHLIFQQKDADYVLSFFRNARTRVDLPSQPSVYVLSRGDIPFLAVWRQNREPARPTPLSYRAVRSVMLTKLNY